MDNNELNDFIKNIGKKAFKRLEELNIPPYPKYYQDSFKDFLKDKDKTIVYLEKNSYLIDAIPNNNDNDITDTCYKIAKESINKFSKTNEDIKKISNKSSIDLNNLSKEIENFDGTKILESFNGFHKTLQNTLKEADDTIMKLQEEIIKLEKESNIDPLTKVFNKRALIKDLGDILNCGLDKKLDLTVMMFDLDDFKKVNDTYGHIAGDKTLIYLGKILKNSLRNEVKVYRFGGEEFFIVLNRIDIEQAKKIGDRILETMRKSKLLYKSSTIRITLSGGITSHKKGDTLDSIIERVDSALYRAKNSGKDRIEVEV